jgi:CDP-paratose 2-epimerase
MSLRTPKNVLVTGSSGLIGSEAVEYFDRLGAQVHGIDNNMRMDFFGPMGDTHWNLKRLRGATHHFIHHDIDIRDRQKISVLLKEAPFDLIIHCAAQPSHDLAANRPLDDFDVNALGTINLLEATRLHSPDAVFLMMSTNKVYGDAPNELPLVEQASRFDYARPEDYHGINETCRIDQSLHSVFGASKVAADIMTQEYGRYYGLRTAVFRGGCLTGPNHSGVELHGFLSYLVKVALKGQTYAIFGYKGKQVRDNIHSLDVMTAIHAFYDSPQAGEVYNLGGGRENSISIIEAISRIEGLIGEKIQTKYTDGNRKGDHICYITDLKKFRSHYPHWKISVPLEQILKVLVEGWQSRQSTG